jgi:hypothetical protein
MGSSLRVLTAGLAIGVFLVSLASAQPTSAPVGHELYLQMGPSGPAHDVINVSGIGGGGRFTGYINTGGFSGSLGQVNLWCVDAQLQFNWNGQYRTNVLGFHEINNEGTTHSGPLGSTPWAAGHRDVRYEDIANFSGPGDRFRNQLVSTNPLVNAGYEAAFRYRMAAWLITQYRSKSSLAGMYDPIDNNVNRAIQRAIWVTMDTTGDTDDVNNDLASIDWFRAAADYVDANFHSSEWSRWAVVSAWEPATAYITNSGLRVQTFLTEVPEPGFYGLLALGLSALVLMRSRRRSTVENV